MMKSIKNEFKKCRFNLKYDKPEDFSTFSWQADRYEISGYFIAYRFLLAALFLSILVARGSLFTTPNYFFIYLTNLTFIVQTLHLVVSSVVLLQFLLQKNKYGLLKWTRLCQFSWFLYNVVNFTSIAVTTIYWALLFKPGNAVNAMGLMVHGLNSIVSIIDILVSGRPCRLMHFYQPFIFCFSYIIFTVIYWAVGGVSENGNTYIYSVLDWNNLKLAIPFVIISLFVALPIVHALLWSLHKLRDFIIKCVTENFSD